MEDSQEIEDINDLAFDSRNFFDTELVPLIALQCSSCHAEPRFNPPLQGPLTIFSFSRVEALLSQGDGPLANTLYEKVAGIQIHGGGDRCIVSPEVCEKIEEWWHNLYDEESTSTTLWGQVSPVTDEGRVTGWAADRNNADTIVSIRVYIDGDASTGTLAFETDASLPGFDNGTSGNHGFALQLDPQYRDGTQRSIYVYATIGDEITLLPGSPASFTAYKPRAEGETYYNNTIRPILENQCGSCHNVDYSVHWASLLSPAPSNGGTATNNELINKPSGRVNHGGGNLCGGLNGSPCALFQEWWSIEFD